MRTPPGVYIESRIKADMDLVWRLTQDPLLINGGTYRFTRIEYLAKTGEREPQRFLYERALVWTCNSRHRRECRDAVEFRRSSHVLF